MITKPEPFSLVTLANGAVIEAIEVALGEIYANLLDPNTDHKARELQIKLTIKPDQETGINKVATLVKTKLSPQKPIESLFVVGDGQDGPEAHEIISASGNPKQGKLFAEQETEVSPVEKDNLRPLKAVTKE